MNVYDNMALGLKLRDLPRTVINTRVKTAAAFLGISDILTKKIRSISDSERQRVALGRAIVCHPKVLLVDDIYTTGSTVDAMAVCLKKNGAGNVYFLTVCTGRR